MCSLVNSNADLLLTQHLCLIERLVILPTAVILVDGGVPFVLLHLTGPVTDKPLIIFVLLRVIVLSI